MRVLVGLIFSLTLSLCVLTSPLFATEYAVFALSDGALTPVDTGIEDTARSAGLKPEVKIEQYAGIIIKGLFGILGLLFMGIIVYAGILWMVSRGESTETKKAREILLYAILGLAVVLIAYALTQFVVDKLVTPTLQ